MLAAMIIAALAGWVSKWWVAALVGTVIGEVSWLYWVPMEVWLDYSLGFLPFAALPAFVGAVSSSQFRKKVHH
jgi:hypothetical protein